MPMQKAAPTEKEFLDALNKVERALGKHEAKMSTAKALPNKDELCKTYHSIKPFLETILPWVERIPIYGKRVADAIRFLMRLADALC
jgi:hypothetical protein